MSFYNPTTIFSSIAVVEPTLDHCQLLFLSSQERMKRLLAIRCCVNQPFQKLIANLLTQENIFYASHTIPKYAAPSMIYLPFAKQ